MATDPTARDLSDVLARARRGSQAAYRQLYDAHVTSVFRFLTQFGGSREDVRDWTQRAFVKAFSRLDQFDGRAAFTTWIFRIALNEMRSDLRRLQIITYHADTPGDETAGNDDDMLAWDHSMRTWLNQLDEQKRSVFILYEVEGFSHREIADMLNIEESHSRTLLSRTKSFLRKQWNDERKAQ